MERLDAFFRENPRVALAFSGGTDSAFLLYAAVRAGADVRPYYVKSAFQPAFELADANAVCRQLAVALTVLETDVLRVPEIVKNASDRCYHCKRAIFSAICAQAAADGYAVLLDGTNASDDIADRPGMRALSELSVRSPLRACGISKNEVRALSRQAGLPTADKPAYACLATRIPTGTPVDAETLARVEAAEDTLFQLGFSGFRARVQADGALLQFTEKDLPRAISEEQALEKRLKPWFSGVRIDPRPLRRD